MRREEARIEVVKGTFASAAIHVLEPHNKNWQRNYSQADVDHLEYANKEGDKVGPKATRDRIQLRRSACL